MEYHYLNQNAFAVIYVLVVTSICIVELYVCPSKFTKKLMEMGERLRNKKEKKGNTDKQD